MKDSKSSFDAIVMPHLADALTLARWLTKSPADAEDVLQEACLRAYARIETYDGSNARGWLLAIVRNVAYTWMQKNRHALLSLDEPLRDDRGGAQMALDVPDRNGETPETVLIAKVDKAGLYRAIESLPIEFREALILREIQGFGYHDIARITSAPIGTVMSRISRARRQLASIILQQAG